MKVESDCRPESSFEDTLHIAGTATTVLRRSNQGSEPVCPYSSKEQKMRSLVYATKEHGFNGRIRPLDTQVGSLTPKQRHLSGIRRRKH